MLELDKLCDTSVSFIRGRRGCDRMVAGFTYAIGDY